jgi:hypothetical protein
MGYYTALHLLDMKIKIESIPIITNILETGKGRGITHIKYFFDVIAIGDDGVLHLINKYNMDSYGHSRKNGTAIALDGKWYDCEEFAHWLKPHCEKGGRIIEHSREGDGNAWGWEYDGKGGLKYFQLDHYGTWK